MKRNDFCIFILSYQRPERARTVRNLKLANYTGPYYIVLGNDDKKIDEYKETFGEEHIIIFDKEAEAKECDTCDNYHKMNIVLYARNVCFKLAEHLGYKYFLELDDDYGKFAYRYFDENDHLCTQYIQEFDDICDLMIDFLEDTQALSVAMAQNGDFMGGSSSTTNLARKGYSRKVMNSFFCTTERPFKFVGTINEDTNTYCLLGSQGNLFLTVSLMAVDQAKTQQRSGGLTEVYNDLGTYVKSFYTLMNCPSFAGLGTVGNDHPRIHHNVKWKYAVPQIISNKYKKK